MANATKSDLIKTYYWFIPIVLFIAQVIFTFNSMSQIRYEELAESVRNPYWLQNKTIYDGISSNVGWYGSLLIVYNLFGFSLHTAKFFRLILHLVSLICLALILKRYLGERRALVPLLAIGLSPSLMYLNTLQTSYGLDLQYLPIAAYLVLSVDFKKKALALVKTAALWFIAMLAWMSYPTFIFYLPVFLGGYLWQMLNQSVLSKTSQMGQYLVVGVLTFMAPLSLAFAYVKDRNMLLFDPQSPGGIFRGGGSFSGDGNLFLANLSTTLSDFFTKSNSYHFDLKKVEFSDFYPYLAVTVVLIYAIQLLVKAKKFRFLILICLYLIFAGLVLVNFNIIPGVRRSTAALAGFYGLFVLIWYKDTLVKNLFLGVLLLIPLHHLIVLPVNTAHLKDPSFYADQSWFKLADTPSQSLEMMVNTIQRQDLNLTCQSQAGVKVVCRLPEVYAAVAGSCDWNQLRCLNIQTFDPRSGQLIELSTKLWEEYYFEH